MINFFIFCVSSNFKSPVTQELFGDYNDNGFSSLPHNSFAFVVTVNFLQPLSEKINGYLFQTLNRILFIKILSLSISPEERINDSFS